MTRTEDGIGSAPDGEQPAVLFVSRRNSLRSVIAHACLAHVGRGRCRADSCGVPRQLADQVHPAALAALQQAGIEPVVQAPRDWTTLRSAGLRPDVVILLDPFDHLDLPPWPGQPATAWWNCPDLAARGAELPPAEVTALLHSLRQRLEILATLLTRSTEGSAVRSDIRDMFL